MSQSVVFQVYSETGTFGVDMAIVAASVVQVLRRQGVEAYVLNEGLEGLAWADAHDVPEADAATIETCEVLLRAWPSGNWPARPDGPRTVVDFVRRPAERSTQADFVVAFESDGTEPFPGLLVWDVLFPLPVEVNDVAKETVEDVVMIHLGQDPTSRLSGLQLAINGFAGMAALGLQYPGGAGGAGIVVTPTPWDHLASGQLAVVTPEFPFRLAAAMRVPAVLVASTTEELTRVQELIARGHSSFLSLGLMSGLTNNQIRDAVRDLRNDDGARRIARLGGSEQRADQGVMRIASWVSRELIGKSVITDDPFNVQGFDTILDPHTQVPLNAAAAFQDGGGTPEEDEVPTNVQVFTADGTWTKPDNAKFVHVRLVSGGGGGGSGRRGAAGTNRGGGGGGAGGTANEVSIPASSLPALVAVVVGAGGLGADGILTDNTDGGMGNGGAFSTFGDFLSSTGIASSTTAPGNGGQAGAGGSGGAAFNPVSSSYLGIPGGGGAGAVGAGVAGTLGQMASAAGGGGGAGIDNTNTGATGGNGGIGSYQRATALTGGTGGASPVQDGGIGASAETDNPQGGGGAGGGASDGAVPGMGGAGGYPGGGGGGGSASVNGTASGAGGQGANGIVVVTTFF